MAVLRASIAKILQHFPQKEIRYAFCYGSAAFQQKGSEMSNNVLDFIFVTDDNERFHNENLKQNKSHYSFLKFFGVKPISYIQGTGVYFNTLVSCENRTIKYGVVSTIDFKSDLLDWTTLYLSGRLHKPIMEILNTDDRGEIQNALRNNRESALHASLLMLPESFTEEQLFNKLASLSYSGDIRMSIAEDQNKVSNIVGPNLDNFREVYADILEHEDHLLWNKEDGTFDQILNFRSRFHHLNLLPCGVQERLTSYRNKDGRSRDAEEVTRILATSDVDCGPMVKRAIADIVRRSSWEQSIKSALTAGVIKSLRYGKAKVGKMLKSRTR